MAFRRRFGEVQFACAPESQWRRITLVDAWFILGPDAVAAGAFAVAFYLASPA